MSNPPDNAAEILEAITAATTLVDLENALALENADWVKRHAESVPLALTFAIAALEASLVAGTRPTHITAVFAATTTLSDLRVALKHNDRDWMRRHAAEIRTALALGVAQIDQTIEVLS